jgi:hypothetical protein
MIFHVKTVGTEPFEEENGQCRALDADNQDNHPSAVLKRFFMKGV